MSARSYTIAAFGAPPSAARSAALSVVLSRVDRWHDVCCSACCPACVPALTRPPPAVRRLSFARCVAAAAQAEPSPAVQKAYLEIYHDVNPRNAVDSNKATSYKRARALLAAPCAGAIIELKTMLTPSASSSNTTFSVRVPLPSSGSAEYRANASGPALVVASVELPECTALVVAAKAMNDPNRLRLGWSFAARWLLVLSTEWGRSPRRRLPLPQPLKGLPKSLNMLSREHLLLSV